MTSECVRFESATGEGQPASDLAPGRWFWRPSAGSTVGPTWAIRIPTATIHERAWGGDFDADGDGLADVIGIVDGGMAWWASGPDGPVGDPRIIWRRRKFEAHWARYTDAGDVDGDGFSDAAVALPGSPWTLTVFRGSPIGLTTSHDGAFPLGTTLYEGTPPVGIGDVDADGFDDVAFRTYYEFTIFRGGRDGMSVSGSIETGGRSPATLQRADVTGDGIPDLSWLDERSSGHYLYTNLDAPPGSALRLQARHTFEDIPQVVAVGDFNGDGVGDGVRRDIDSLEVFLGGPRPLRVSRVIAASSVDPCTAGHPQASGDFDGDGRDDLLITGVACLAWWPDPLREGASPVILLEGFGTAPVDGVSRAGDLDGDGKDDLRIQPYPRADAHVRGLMSWASLTDSGGPGIRESGTFRSIESRGGSTPVSSPFAMVGDLDGDGAAELVGSTVGACNRIVVWSRPAVSDPPPSPSCSEVVAGLTDVGDVDGDGIGDLTTIGPATVSLYRYGHARDGNLVSPLFPTRRPDGTTAVAFPAGDVNHDGVDDIVRYASAENTVFFGVRGGVPREGAVFTSPVRGAPITIFPAGDVNGDGYGDVVVAGMSWAIHAGSATGLRSLPLLETTDSIIPIGDADGDAVDDVILWRYSSMRYLHGTRDGLREVAPVEPARSLTGSSGSPIALGDVNGDHLADFGVSTYFYDDPDRPFHEPAIVFGSSRGPDRAHPLTWHAMSDRPLIFGSRGPHAGAGDWDGDGVTDVLMTVDRTLWTRSLARPRGRPPILLRSR